MPDAALLLAAFCAPSAVAAYLYLALRAERAYSARLRETCDAWAVVAAATRPPTAFGDGGRRA